MKRETDLFKIEDHPLSKTHHFTGDIIAGPYMDEDGKMYGFFRGIGGIHTKDEITDSQRVDFLEKQHPQIWSDLSVNPRYSVDGGDTWHNDLRSAIDAAMER